MKTHVCLVSDQLIPNVLPVMREKPERVILLTTGKMQNKAALLRDFLQRRGASVASQPIDAYDFASTLAACREVIDRCGPKGDITLNVTGGTKVAALAAYQSFYFDNCRIIYMDTDNGQLLELGDQTAAHPFADNLLKVRDHLALYGKTAFAPNAETRSLEEVRNGRANTSLLCSLFLHNPEVLHSINGQLARQVQSNIPQLDFAGMDEPGVQVYDLLVQTGVAEPADSTRLCVPDRANRFYLHGGWLEEYVFNTVADMQLAGMDSQLNVGIEWNADVTGRKRTTNELDVLFTHQNRLHVISCKTSRLDEETSEGRGALYELDSLHTSAGGLFARAMLVSFHKLKEHDARRAKDMRITVVEGDDIRRLREIMLTKWNLRA